MVTLGPLRLQFTYIGDFLELRNWNNQGPFMVCLGFLSANCKDNQAETSPSPSLSPTLAAWCSLFGKKFVQLRAIYIVIVWIRMKPMFCVLPFFFFFPACISALGDKSTVHALLSIVHTPFSTVHELKNIKNESHGIIHTFKNYFTTVFSVSAKISCIQMNP